MSGLELILRTHQVPTDFFTGLATAPSWAGYIHCDLTVPYLTKREATAKSKIQFDSKLLPCQWCMREEICKVVEGGYELVAGRSLISIWSGRVRDTETGEILSAGAAVQIDENVVCRILGVPKDES